MRLKDREEPSSGHLSQRGQARADLLGIVGVVVVDRHSRRRDSRQIVAAADPVEPFQRFQSGLLIEAQHLQHGENGQRIGGGVGSGRGQGDVEFPVEDPVGDEAPGSILLEPVGRYAAVGIGTVGTVEDLYLQLPVVQQVPDGFPDFALHHGPLADVVQEGGEDLSQLLLAVVVGTHVEHYGVIRGVVEQALVAFIRFEDEVFPRAGVEVARGISGNEALGNGSVEKSRVGAAVGQSFGHVGGDGALAAAPRHGDAAELPRAGKKFRKERGAVEPSYAFPGQKIGVVLFDCAGVDQCVGSSFPDIGAVLRKNDDPLIFQRGEDGGVFGFCGGPVAAGDLHAQCAAPGGQSGHADPPDADEVQMSHSGLPFG